MEEKELNKDEIIEKLKLKLIKAEKAYLEEHVKVCQFQFEKLLEQEKNLNEK